MNACFPVLVLAATAFGGGQQHVVSADPILDHEKSIAAQVESRVHIKSFDARARAPQIRIETKATLSSYRDRVIREARWEDLPRPLQVRFNLWASYTADEDTGQQFFADTFYRFFFVRELGHWLQSAVPGSKPPQKDPAAHLWQSELAANRISVAWWREQDPEYLSRLMKDFRSVQQKLHNPVPPGQDMPAYFAKNYEELGKNPDANAWFQIELALIANDERPVLTFQQAADGLQSGLQNALQDALQKEKQGSQ